MTLDEVERRTAAEDAEILLALCRFVASHLDRIKTVSLDEFFLFSRYFHDIVLRLVRTSAAEPRWLRKEWFQAVETWCSCVLGHDLIGLADEASLLAMTFGAKKYPAIYQSLVRIQGHLILLRGAIGSDAETYACGYAVRPYLMPDRQGRAAIYGIYSRILIANHQFTEHRQMLWRGLTELYFDDALRTNFLQALRTTYRGTIGTLIRGEVHTIDKLLFLLLSLRTLVARLAGRAAARPLTYLSLAGLYVRNYGRSTAVRFAVGGRNSSHGRKKILVTRVMGGIGDLLAMTPGLHALKKRFPDHDIHFAVQHNYLDIFRFNDDICCLDIADRGIALPEYDRWYNLSDCPAARVESRQRPNVRRNRIALFASGLGIGPWALKRHGTRPRYDVSAEERQEAEQVLRDMNPEGRQTVALQPFAADGYKDYPEVERLANRLAETCLVVLFDDRRLGGFKGDNIHKVRLPLRQAVALAAACDVIVGPDSSFMHFAAALDRPGVAIFGPTDGRLWAKSYRSVTMVMPDRTQFPCSPCWRNENNDCALGACRDSLCLASLPVERIAEAVRQRLA
jgi:ADP-heptose:LPS heptosyltransferase